MKTCIIGSKEKNETDKLFMDTAKKLGEVLYVPIEDISLTIDNGINFTYEYENITEYDAILFLIPKSKYSLAGMILEALPEDVTLLNSPRCFYTSCSKIPFYEKLSSSGVKVPKSIFADNPQAAISDVNLLRFPIMVKVPTGKEKVMLAYSEQEVKSMVDALQVLKQPMILEEYYPEAKILSAFVLDNEIIAGVERNPEEINYIGGKIKEVKLKRNVENMALEVTEILNTDFARIDFLNTAKPTVADINICPNINEVCKICNTNIAEKIIFNLKNKFESDQQVPKLAKTIKDVFRDAF